MPINATIRCFYAESATCIWLVIGYKIALALLFRAVDAWFLLHVFTVTKWTYM